MRDQKCQKTVKLENQKDVFHCRRWCSSFATEAKKTF